MPRDADLDLAGDDGALQALDLAQHAVGDIDGVRPLALGDGQGHGRPEGADPRHRAGLVGAALVAGAGPEEDILVRLVGAIADAGHVAQPDRLACLHPDHHGFHGLDVLQEGAGLDQDLLTVDVDAAGGQRLVRLAQCPRQLGQRQPAARHGSAVGHHPHPARQATDQGRLTDLIHLLDRIVDLCRDAPQDAVVIGIAPEGQGQDRHIVDGAYLDQGLAHAGRNAVQVGGDLGVELDHGVGRRVADLETHNHHRPPGAAGGVEVLHAGNLPQQFLQGPGDALFDFCRRRRRHLDEDVNHRHDNLRLLLARQEPDRRGPQQDGGQNDQRRQLRIDEQLDDGRRHATAMGRMLVVLHGAPSPAGGGVAAGTGTSAGAALTVTGS